MKIQEMSDLLRRAAPAMASTLMTLAGASCVIPGGEGAICKYKRHTWSRVVGVDLQVSEQERFTAGLIAATTGLDSYKYRVDLRQRFRVITL